MSRPGYPLRKALVTHPSMNPSSRTSSVMDSFRQHCGGGSYSLAARQASSSESFTASLFLNIVGMCCSQTIKERNLSRSPLVPAMKKSRHGMFPWGRVDAFFFPGLNRHSSLLLLQQLRNDLPCQINLSGRTCQDLFFFLGWLVLGAIWIE